MARIVVDSLDIFGNPELELPLDIGDGPFARPDPNLLENLSVPALGDSSLQSNALSSIERQIDSGRGIVSAATIFVSDIIPANSFRRFQHDVNMPRTVVDRILVDLRHEIVVRFHGAASAVLKEKIENSEGSGPPSNALDALLAALEAANNAAENESTSSDAIVDWRAPLPPSQSFYFIRFRRPGLEFNFGQSKMDYSPSRATGLKDENKLEEFRFNVDARREFNFRYPMGRRIPIVFDIINRHTRAISADLYVEVLITQ